MDFIEFGKDLPNTEPEFSLPIKWVGIEDLESNICFLSLFDCDTNRVHLACKISLYCDLSEDRRGIHLSRFSESLINLIEANPRSIFKFCEELAQKIRRVQNQKFGKVALNCKHIIKKKTAVTSLSTLIPLHIGVETIITPSEIFYKSSLGVEIITACPCGIEMSKSIKKPNRSKIHKRKNNFINNSENIYTHSQRGFLELSVRSQIPIKHKYLFKIAAKICPMVGTTLKRPDELHLVKTTYKNPMFCEDIVRKSLIEMKHFFKSKGTNPLFYKTYVRSEESIHPFSIIAHGEIKKN